MNTYSFKASEKVIKDIYEYFNGNYSTNPKNQYIKYIFNPNDAIITVYTSDKVVITGKDADTYNTMFNLDPTASKPKENKTSAVNNTIPQAGSDEVGTGDFFGPICVCAAIVDENTYQKIKQFNLDDSKKLTDKYILEVAPKLMEIVPHSLLVVDNEKYNQVIQENNMNKIKALLHNQCYLNLLKKGYSLPKLVVIDQFCPEAKYYQHLSGKQIVRNIHFETKAESKFISVAIGSMISRYAFLQHMEKMGEKYDCTFPKGAGSKVDEFAREFVRKYGFEELNKVAKMNFANVNKI